jgi:hypothetical protein
VVLRPHVDVLDVPYRAKASFPGLHNSSLTRHAIGKYRDLQKTLRQRGPRQIVWGLFLSLFGPTNVNMNVRKGRVVPKKSQTGCD